jgi:hypothetical protein
MKRIACLLEVSGSQWWNPGFIRYDERAGGKSTRPAKKFLARVS